jgi:general secretion pathway protein H
MPTSVRGNSRAAAGAGAAWRGFTLIELLVVIVLVAMGGAVVSLALRDRDAARLEEEAARLAALLEAARTEARAAGLAVRWVPAPAADAAGVADGPTGFRFVGLPSAFALPTRWLEPRVSAQVVGGAALVLGPDAILPPQRVVLALDDRRLEIGSDGLGPFAVQTPAEAAEPAERAEQR